MEVTFFTSPAEFRKWLEKNHTSVKEIFVGYYKVGSGKPSMTWSQSVDQALCFGWIDGVRRSIDHESYNIRFTPRKQDSNWSSVNIKKVEELTKTGQMTPAGLKAFSFRKECKSGIYAFENEAARLDTDYENTFKKNKIAWTFFIQQAPSYQKVMIHWIMSAKQDKTRLSRLEKTIDFCERGKKML